MRRKRRDGQRKKKKRRKRDGNRETGVKKKIRCAAKTIETEPS